MNSTDFIATSTPMTEREKSDNDYHKKRYQSLWNMYEDQKKELENLRKLVPTGISSSRQTAPGVQMPHRPQATISLTQNNEEIEDWELRYYALSEENSELKTQIQAMELHNGIQSRYCLHFGTVMGAVMNSMSWNAEAVKHIVKNAGLVEFIDIVRETIISFVEYKTSNGQQFQEQKAILFVRCLMSVITNVTVVQEGREFLSSHPAGKRLIADYVDHMGKDMIDCIIMRHVVATLCNVSATQLGLAQLSESHNLASHIKKGLEISSSWNDQTKTSCVQLAISLTKNNKNREFFDHFRVTLCHQCLLDVKLRASTQMKSLVAQLQLILHEKC